jgi:HPt (histidine-containing phosphotransfer) domain-containing protein
MTATCLEAPGCLLDDGVLAMLQGVTDADEFQSLLAMGASSFESYWRAMQACNGDADRVRREAHKLKGSAGSLGWREVGRIAAWLEAQADDAAQVSTGLARLALAMRETREALVARGMLAG